MTLYKCIGFGKDYCSGYIVNEQKIRFATMEELQKGNDKNELRYDLETKSSIIQLVNKEELQRVYKNGFAATMVLSMGKTKTKKVWDEYCPFGGIRYEFDFTPNKASDISHGDVSYRNDKIYNVWKYIIKNEKKSEYKRILRYEGGVTPKEIALFLQWTKRPESLELMSRHITDEIVLKKESAFSFEDEYRFIHLKEPIGQLNALKVNLIDQKATLEEVGLKLKSISTNDIKLAESIIRTRDVPIQPIQFE